MITDALLAAGKQASVGASSEIPAECEGFRRPDLKIVVAQAESEIPKRGTEGPRIRVDSCLEFARQLLRQCERSSSDRGCGQRAAALSTLFEETEVLMRPLAAGGRSRSRMSTFVRDFTAAQGLVALLKRKKRRNLNEATLSGFGQISENIEGTVAHSRVVEIHHREYFAL